MEPTSELFLASIRLETLKNDIKRLQAKIDAKEMEIAIIEMKYEKASITTLPHSNYSGSLRLFDSNGKRLSKVVGSIQQKA